MTLSEELRRRLLPLLPYLRSPVDQSALAFSAGEEALLDGSGRRFLITGDVPVLIPNLNELLERHYEVCLQKGRAPEALLRQEMNLLEFTGYVLGGRFTVRSTRRTSPIEGPPGLLTENEQGRPLVQSGRGTWLVQDFEYQSAFVRTSNWSEFRKNIVVAPPFFLTDQRIPDRTISTYSEILPFLNEAPSYLVKEDCRDKAERHRLNIPFHQWLFEEYGLNVTAKPVLDIGCADGWLLAAMEAAGALLPLGSDVRKSSLGKYLESYPEARRGFLFMADMFEWCYAPNSYTFIAVRNNGALSKTSAFGEEFLEFGRNLSRSLVPGGVAYLSYISGGTNQTTDDGLANPSVDRVLAYLRECGLGIVKTMRLGSPTAHLVCRPEDESRLRRLASRISARQRAAAFREYYESAESSDPRILRNFFLAMADWVSEIAQECHLMKKPRVSLWGPGILAYYTWRLLNIFYPNLPVAGFVVPSHMKGQSALYPVTADEARKHWGQDQLKVNLDVGEQFSDIKDFDLRFCEREFEVNLPQNWSYHFISGDYDFFLPRQICEYYLNGRLGNLGRELPDPAKSEFEKELLRTFPIGFKGVY